MRALRNLLVRLRKLVLEADPEVWWYRDEDNKLIAFCNLMKEGVPPFLNILERNIEQVERAANYLDAGNTRDARRVLQQILVESNEKIEP